MPLCVSPIFLVIRLPMSLSRSPKAAPRTPVVSIASDTKSYSWLLTAYRWRLLSLGERVATLAQGAAERVNAGGVPQRYPVPGEGDDSDAIRPASVSTVTAPWLKSCQHTGCCQEQVQDVTDGCMTRQAARISPGGQVVVAQSVTRDSTMTSVGLLD